MSEQILPPLHLNLQAAREYDYARDEAARDEVAFDSQRDDTLTEKQRIVAEHERVKAEYERVKAEYEKQLAALDDTLARLGAQHAEAGRRKADAERHAEMHRAMVRGLCKEWGIEEPTLPAGTPAPPPGPQITAEDPLGLAGRRPDQWPVDGVIS
jgi:septal ring factor EnvC (AmiA/AmiB activator)